MREILFRGKQIDDCDWVYGSSVVYPEEKTALIYQLSAEFRSIGIFIVDLATVGQYTGLKDRNGTRIFEGDIVRHYNRHDDPDAYERGLVFWNKKKCCFMRTSGDGSAWLGDHCDYEVIGNIYDTPELLEASV